MIYLFKGREHYLEFHEYEFDPVMESPSKEEDEFEEDKEGLDENHSSRKRIRSNCG